MLSRGRCRLTQSVVVISRICACQILAFQAHIHGGMTMSKAAKAARKADLVAARDASARGDIATARALFAKHGIGYVPVFATEGN